MFFSMKINIKVLYKLIVLLLVIACMPKVSKIASLQYLCNISKKKGGMKLSFFMQINIELSYKLTQLILMGKARPDQITKNNMFAKSLQYLKKKVKDVVDFLCNEYHSFL